MSGLLFKVDNTSPKEESEIRVVMEENLREGKDQKDWTDKIL